MRCMRVLCCLFYLKSDRCVILGCVVCDMLHSVLIIWYCPVVLYCCCPLVCVVCVLLIHIIMFNIMAFTFTCFMLYCAYVYAGMYTIMSEPMLCCWSVYTDRSYIVCIQACVHTQHVVVTVVVYVAVYTNTHVICTVQVVICECVRLYINSAVCILHFNSRINIGVAVLCVVLCV